MATIDHRSQCGECQAQLVHLVGDPSVPYEDIEPLEGGPPTLVEHTEERCQFHQFLTPDPRNHVLPGNAAWLTKRATDQPRKLRFRRWVRE
ncbi:hypothetical protein GCM10023321_26350 [Pseudonocardia eucalypti]|uniref:Uncharacterized protein n=1 Tax=Pseudonocardia eucalypti TaxID=648755 RepID=A0ABP9Q309_9PSEU|nr:hypothetical protein [Pseudonocardia eucalypti]